MKKSLILLLPIWGVFFLLTLVFGETITYNDKTKTHIIPMETTCLICAGIGLIIGIIITIKIRNDE